MLRGAARLSCTLAFCCGALLTLANGAEEKGPPDPDAEIAAGRAELPGLKLDLLFPRKQYQLGEPIEVTLRYTYSGNRKLTVYTATHDRTGMLIRYRFSAVAKDGHAVRDPLSDVHTLGFGWLDGHEAFGPGQPYEQKAMMNECLAFDQPGKYSVTARSHTVHFDDLGTGDNGVSISLTSKPVEIEIIPFDEQQRVKDIAAAAEALKSAKNQERRAAMQKLWFMMDQRAIPLMLANQADDSGYVAVPAYFGVCSFADMTPIKTAVLKLLDDDSTLVRPYDLGHYTWLLAQADVRQQKPGKEEEFAAQLRASDHWLAIYKKKLRERYDKLPAPQSAEYIVESLSYEPTLSPAEVADWKLVLDNVSAPPRDKQCKAAGKVEQCRCKEMVPNLEALAADPRLEPRLRGAAIVALHAMDKDPQREVVYADCISEKPAFSDEVHRTLGEYKAAEIGRALLKLLESPKNEVRESAAGRLGDYGWALKADELKAALERWLATDHPPFEREFRGQPELLTALAIASPEMALPFIKDIILAAPREQGRFNFLRSSVFYLLVCIESPDALKLIKDSLSSPNEDVRGEVANALGYAWKSGFDIEVPTKDVPDPRKRHMQGTNRIPGRFYPKLLELYKSDPSNKVRVDARRALILITGVGNGTWSATQVQEKQWLSEWEAWWEEHRARFEKD